MRSMTGYGAGAQPLGAGRLLVEARSVNHRFLELRIQLPESLEEHQFALERAARERLDRGRFDVRVRHEIDDVPALEIDLGRARAAMLALAALRDEVAPDAELPLSLLSAVPDLFRAAAAPEAGEVRRALVSALEAALDDLVGMREREGVVLAIELRRHLAQVREHIAFVSARGAGLVERQRERLSQRVAQLASGAEIDPGRLEIEIAIFADRSDVTEELARLACHVDQAEALLGGGEPVGRRLDFLLQEMGREANTIGSKSPDASIAQRVVDLKADLERLRQQVQNVE